MHSDPIWMRALLGVHVTAGMVSFVLAPVAIASAKGGKTHKRWGLVYMWAMGIVAGTALPMALWRPVLFLAMVSILAFYLTFSGYRVLRLKDMARGGQAHLVDWVAAGLTFCACAAVTVVGWVDPKVLHGPPVVPIVLGLVGMRASGSDLLMFYRKPVDRMFWWYSHLAKFLASYIAAWTAFSTATLSHVFRHAGLILWFWPISVGVPAIVLTTIYYKRKFAGTKKDAGLVAA